MGAYCVCTLRANTPCPHNQFSLENKDCGKGWAVGGAVDETLEFVVIPMIDAGYECMSYCCWQCCCRLWDHWWNLWHPNKRGNEHPYMLLKWLLHYHCTMVTTASTVILLWWRLLSFSTQSASNTGSPFFTMGGCVVEISTVAGIAVIVGLGGGI